MPRVSFRNIISALTASKIDVSGKGAAVSDDIQLVYVLDDIRESLYGYGAVGDFTPGLGGENHILQVQVNNVRGLIIDEMVSVFPDTSGWRMKVFTEDFPAIITNERVEPLGISEGIPTRARVLSGTVPASIFNSIVPGFTVFMGNPGQVGALQGLFIGQGRFLKMVDTLSSHSSQWSLRWHELGD